jgi:TfoX/Sxy family transcriptional regulator of competence genes
VAFDEGLAERVRETLAPRGGVSERKMFGGIAFMVNGNMACGVLGDELIVRMAPEDAERALGDEHTRPFDFTGRPSKGTLYVAPEALESDSGLATWVDAGADFAASLPPK